MNSKLFGCALLAISSIAAASTASADGKHVLGIQDSKTGAFRPLNRIVPDSSTTSPTTGTVEVTFNIKLVSSFKKGTLLVCSIGLDGAATNEDTGISAFYGEDASVGVDISGGTATCTVNIPYSWLLPASSKTVIDSFSGTYTVGVDPYSIGAVTTGLFERSSSGSYVSADKIPSSGTTSKYTVAVTL